jgi:hypothetical protein
MPSCLSLERRLAGYALAAGTALAAGSVARAAIVYTDLDPDQVFTFGEGPQVFQLDLDGDTLIDVDLQFTFTTSTFTLDGIDVVRNEYTLYAIGKSMNLVMNTAAPLAKAFNSGHSIHHASTLTASLSFKSQGRMGRHFTDVYSTGKVDSWNGVAHFSGKNRKILMIRFMKGGLWHNGWCRVSVATDTNQFTVHDYAYNDLAGTAIVPGAYLSPTLRGAVGGVINLKAVDVPGTVGGFFTAVPKVVARYIDPVKGGKAKKVTLKGALSGDSSTLILNVKKKVRLYDAKAFKFYYGQGMRARDLEPHTSQAMLFDLEVTHEEGGAPQTVRCAHLSLKPPRIIGLVPMPPGANPVITGQWFGVKLPKAWVEYRVANPKTGGVIVKKAKVKVLKDFIHQDTKGKPACMDPNSGESQITIQLPDAWPKGFDDIDLGTHDLVIDNGVGLDYVELIPPF